MPFVVLVMLLFWMVLLLLAVPTLLMLIELLAPKPTPNSVVMLLLPTRLRFLMVLLVAATLTLAFWPQITALVMLTLVWVRVVSRVAAVGALRLLEFEPLMMTQLAPLRTIRADAEE